MFTRSCGERARTKRFACLRRAILTFPCIAILFYNNPVRWTRKVSRRCGAAKTPWGKRASRHRAEARLGCRSEQQFLSLRRRRGSHASGCWPGAWPRSLPARRAQYGGKWFRLSGDSGPLFPQHPIGGTSFVSVESIFGSADFRTRIGVTSNGRRYPAQTADWNPSVLAFRGPITIFPSINLASGDL